MQFAISSIRDVSGVNLELLGLRDAQQAGVLEEQRKQAGMTILASLFNSLRHYRKRQGRVMLYFIQNYMSDGRLIRIVGEDKEQYVPLVREPEGRQYDVIVDDTANSPNQKERTWVLIMQMFPILGKVLGAEEMLALAEWSPLPHQRGEEAQGGVCRETAAECRQAGSDRAGRHGADASRCGENQG